MQIFSTNLVQQEKLLDGRRLPIRKARLYVHDSFPSDHRTGCSRTCRSNSANRASRRLITSNSIPCVSGDDEGWIIGEMKTEAPGAGDASSGRAATDLAEQTQVKELGRLCA